jgi:hypothetical protein
MPGQALLTYATDVEGLGTTLLGLLCCVVGMIGVLSLLGAVAVNMRSK